MCHFCVVGYVNATFNTFYVMRSVFRKLTSESKNLSIYRFRIGTRPSTVSLHLYNSICYSECVYTKDYGTGHCSKYRAGCILSAVWYRVVVMQ